MKKIIIVSSVICSLALVFFGVSFFNQNPKTAEGFLRFHIRANSDSQQDQVVKLLVMEEVVAYIEPRVKATSSAKEAIEIINNNIKMIEQISIAVLRANGFGYGASARLSQEHFPTRSYNGTVLENGFYDALIITLGNGNGQNWWCVIYPPLCFISGGTGDNVEYRSILWDLIKRNA